MVKELVVAVALGILNTALVALSILGNVGGSSFGTAFQTLAFWILSLIPLFVSGLGFGVRSAAISVGTSVVVAAIAIDTGFALAYAVISGLPVIILVRQALLWRESDGTRYWYPADNLLIWWAGICIGLTGLAIGLLHWDEALRQGMVEAFLGPIWGMFILMSGCLAQGLLVRFKKNIRPTPELTKMALPNWLALAFIAATALSVILDASLPLLGAVVITLETLFFLQGMAVIHVVSHRWNGRPFILGAVYILMIMTLWLVLLIAILGLMENWIGFRRRFAVTTKLEED